ncbi:MAG: glycosyltransferase family 4 protein [Elusimicrobia bacterium]|nr:glycosyltransferase family 4 protein [Elusimicrobiota bacterium]
MSAPVRSVLMLSQTFHPDIGGAEKQALEISRALAGRGVKVTVLTRQPGGLASEEDLGGVAVKRLPVFGPRAVDSALFMLKSFFWLLRHSGEYDAVHVHLASSPAVGAVLAGKLTGRKTLVKLGGGRGVDEITRSEHSLLGRLKLAFFRLARPELLVMNDDVFNWLKNSREFSGLRLRRFRNGVDTGRYTPLLYNEKINAKTALGFENSTLFLFVGRLSPEKRLKEFLEAWAEIFSEDSPAPKIRLVIVGGGPEEAALRKAVADLGVAGSVTLAGSREDLLPYYRAADVFVLPSISEGLSNSMLEAMACGVAVMASRVGGARDAIAHGVSGSLFDPLNRVELKACLRAFVADRSLALKMGEQARKTAVERYSMARVADELMAIYSENGN